MRFLWLLRSLVSPFFCPDCGKREPEWRGGWWACKLCGRKLVGRKPT